MSTGTTKKTGTPRNVQQAVKHLRRQLKLSMEKFGARVGCSFQTVVRWEAGKARINYLNLLKLLTLAQELDPIAAPIFADEMRRYRAASEIGGMDETHLNQELAAASTAKLRGLKTALDEVQYLLEEGQTNKAGLRLKKVRNELQSWIDETEQQQTRNEELEL